MKYIKEYIEFLKDLKEKNMSSLYILNSVTEEYKNARIMNANLESDGDMLLLQWENTNSEDVLTITRQIVQSDDSEEEFDDSAVQINIELYFKNSKFLLSAGNIWIENPSLLNERLESILKKEELKDILNVVPDKIRTIESKI